MRIYIANAPKEKIVLFDAVLFCPFMRGDKFTSDQGLHR